MLGREGSGEGMERALAGLFVRLDKASSYDELSDVLTGMGPTAREELVDLIQGQKLQEEDEWEVFKGSKQGIVKRAYELLEMFNGDTDQAVAACGTVLLCTRIKRSSICFLLHCTV